jgi:hypothetical protein
MIKRIINHTSHAAKALAMAHDNDYLNMRVPLARERPFWVEYEKQKITGILPLSASE